MIQFWHACEMFSPQDLPKIDHRDPQAPVFDVEPGARLPWEAGHELRKRPIKPTMAWRHIVYGGIFGLDKVRDLMERTFGRDPESVDGMSPGSSALFALVITDEGRALLGTEVISSCAWAAGRTIHPGPAAADWLSGFDTVCDQAALEMQAAVGAFENDARAAELRDQGYEVGRPLGYGELAGLIKLTGELLGVGTVLSPGGIRITSLQVSRKREFTAEEGTDFLNSFIAKDLQRVSELVRHGRYGAALETYMRTSEPARVDLRRRPEVLFDRVAPDKVPLGRWPQAAEMPLALSQQFAVNSVMAELAPSAGMFAVNGPPGTGKTTMLRDLIAAIVVERAHRLSKLSTPGAAFTGTHRWTSGVYKRVIRAWREDLTGFEIVVASANNGAVQNVTLEIPGKSAIHPPWRDATDYFADIGARVLGQPAWGLGAARLGRKSYRQEFVEKAWYGSTTKNQQGLLDVLKAWELETGDGGTGTWGEAVKAFSLAYQRARALQDERSTVHRYQRELPELARRIAETTSAVSSKEKDLEQAQRLLGSAEATLATAQEEATRWSHRRREHQGLQPSLITALFTLGKATRAWHAEDQELLRHQQAAQAAAGKADESVQGRKGDITRISGELAAARAHLTKQRSQAAEIRRTLDRLAGALGDFAPGDDWWTDDTKRELSAPWIDSAWNTARSELFVEALRLHQAFLRAEATTMRRNLQGAMDVLTGAAPTTTAEDAVRAAWQSLFFVVPVVSTTFSSIDRMFTHLTRESLGWLLIDEAGQATPQAAVGAIWRSRRAVVVGDPLQLEPVFTLPFTAQQALRRHFRVPEERWLPGRTSVQQLADHANTYGTFLPTDDEPVWVGAPLRVHRRCDEPMFGISNKIAYDGLMVFGKSSGQALDWPVSAWIDVASTESDGHWIPEEGRALAWVLNGLVTGYGVDPENIMVIGPFRQVARGVTKIAESYRKIKAGTVHTAQGKEADIVILVLGGDPSKPGAKSWAAQRPNLLNVAVSRAKRRLYVIGNRAEWSRQRYFNVLAANLDVRPYPAE
ncbi:DEAD/DEAH box helicase [Sphaerisporangium krabiense]|uniref:DNA helicase n=1 Tax=Sphaerisporangium krabiense TaxID=763782 RepID=A0A7W8Z7H5_9ACTN|nr:DEAD/DEAH box helicase [Sphaerisporangium krabiense]MBB5628893.1 hypothetical protein [Sphaerisporangium krabiense]